MSDFYGEHLISSCKSMLWDYSRSWIHKYPRSILFRADGINAAYYAARYGGIDILRLMRNTIKSFKLPPEEHRQMLWEVFERGDSYCAAPIVGATALNQVQCMDFLVHTCPSGVEILERRDDGKNLLHIASNNDRGTNSLEYVLRNSISSFAMLQEKWHTSICSPLPLQLGGARKYFTPRKLEEIGFDRELALLEQCCIFEPDSLVQLMLGVVKQSIEVQRCQYPK